MDFRGYSSCQEDDESRLDHFFAKEKTRCRAHIFFHPCDELAGRNHRLSSLPVATVQSCPFYFPFNFVNGTRSVARLVN